MKMRLRPAIALTMAVAALCLAARASLGQEKTSAGDKYALLVGVRKYDPNELRPLPYSEADVVDLAGVLKAEGYKPGNVVLMTQTAGAEDTRFLPLAANVRKELKLLLDALDESDSVLIALAGHGVQFQGDDESYFCPADARLEDKSTLVPLSEIYHALEKSPAGLKVLLVDACRNDPQSQNARARDVVKLESVTRPRRTPPPGGVVAFFSCSEGEKAYEHADLKHGVFFHFVIEALKGAALAEDQQDVMVLDLVKYVTKNVKDFVRDKYGVRQQPEWKGTSRDLVPLVCLERRAPVTARSIPRLAIQLRWPGERLAAKLKVPPSQPLVSFVVPGGGGDRIGFKAGDVVLAVDGFPVSSPPDALAAIRNRELDSRIEFTVARAGQNVSLSGRFGTHLPDAQVVSRVRQFAERGDPEAQTYLGNMLTGGQYALKDDAEAVRWFRKAADQGHAGAQASLGEMYFKGKGVPKDDVEAAAWLRKAADQGDPNGQNGLGLLYRNGQGVPRDDMMAVRWYRKAADQGLPMAENNLGVMFKEGRGVANDDTEAVARFRKAAAGGVALGQVNLGLMYVYGRGVTKDEAAGVRLIRKVADQGNAVGEHHLGMLFRDGHGVPQSEAEALAWFRKAADHGYASAQSDIGWMHENGRGVPKNDAEAVVWYHKAALQGLALGQFNLARMCEAGRGVQANVPVAIDWYRLAAKGGNTAAAQALKRLNAQP